MDTSSLAPEHIFSSDHIIIFSSCDLQEKKENPRVLQASGLVSPGETAGAVRSERLRH